MSKFSKNYNVLLLFIVVCAAIFVQCRSDSVNSNANRADPLIEVDSMRLWADQLLSNPERPDVHLARAQYQFNRAIYTEAIRDLILCTEIDSSLTACWHLLAESYMEDNRSRLAIEALEEYLEIRPNHVSTLLQLAEYQLIIKRYRAAHFNLNAVLKQERHHAHALFLKGLIYKYEDDPIKAVEYLQEAVQSDPDLVDGHLLLGQLFEEAGNPMARKFYENAIRVDPENAESKMALANYYWMTDDLDQAIGAFQNLLNDHPQFGRGYFNLGLIYLEMDSLISAQNVLEKSVVYEPDLILGHYYLAEAKILSGNWEGARPHLLEASKLSPGDEKIRRRLTEVNDKLGLSN